MILEHAVLHVTLGREDEFMAAMGRALAIIESAPGCHGASVQREIEDPSTFLLSVRWESVAAHMEGFRESELFEQWREATHQFYSDRPHVTHFGEPIPRS